MQSLRFSPDDRFLAVGIRRQQTQRWQVAPALGYRTLVRDPVLGKGEYYVCATSPKDRLLAVGMQDGVGLWDLSTGNSLAVLSSERCNATAVAFDHVRRPTDQ